MPGLLDIEHAGSRHNQLAPGFPDEGDNDSDGSCPGLISGSESSESESESEGEDDFMRRMICHETLTFSGKDDEVEKEEAFPLGKSDVCRAKLEVYTATGALVKVTIAPDTVSSVVMASRPLLHGLHSSNSGTITTSGGSNSLSERGYLIIPHKVRGSAIVPGFAADKASLPGNCSVLLSKRANSSLQVSTDAHCDIEVTPGAEEPDLMFRAKPIGGPLTHTIKGKDGVEHMCRIDSDFSWGRPTDPRPTVLVGRDDMVVVQWSDGTHSLLRDKWLVPIKCCDRFI